MRAPVPPHSTRWAQSRTGQNTSYSGARLHTAGPLTLSYSSLAWTGEQEFRERKLDRFSFNISSRLVQVRVCNTWTASINTVLKVNKRVKDLKEHLPIRMRANLCRGFVLLRPVLLGIFWQDLTVWKGKSLDQAAPLQHFFMKLLVHHLFKPLFDVRVCLQLDLSAGVGPVHEEKPLLGVHLFDQYGCFLVVPHLKNKMHHFL